jgi:hypothetical protein
MTGMQDRHLDRLLEIELTEIPRLRSALSEWVDDPLLAVRMRELLDEADGLRRTLGWSTGTSDRGRAPSR